MNCTLRTAASFVAASIAALVPRPAAACGGFYGDQVEVDPDQKILLVHRAGVETYVFQPRFCGTAKDFGVILPLPSTLTANPALANVALFDQLDRYTAPTVVEACKPSGVGCGTVGDKGGVEPPPFGTGVDVIDGGQVGPLDWTLLQASSVGAFTDWLTTNGYPYDSSQTDAYQHYVTNGWFFVAFRVSAAQAPPAGMRLCENLGPIQLSFAAASPVVPARIAGVNVGSYPSPTWRVFVVSSAQYRSTWVGSSLHFSGTLDQAVAPDYAELAALTTAGDRLTAIDVHFPYEPITSDIVLEQEPFPSDFRSTTTRYVDCGGCQAGGAPAGFALAAAVMILVRAARRRTRARC